MKLLVLLSFSMLLATGQIMFKYAAADITQRMGSMALPWSLLSPPLIGALILYAGATGLWVWILTDTPLSRAYPFALLGAVVVPAASVLLFKESLPATYPVGFLMICAGLYLCVR